MSHPQKTRFMPKQKKQHSVHIRLTGKMEAEIGNALLTSNRDKSRECELAIIDGLLARQLLNQATLEDNRKKYL